SGETQFYHFDRSGNTLLMTDHEGKVLVAYAYGPHGEPVGQAGAVDDNPFTFVGQYGVMDEGDGLYLMTTRRYDAHTGRFVQRDRIGLAGGLNLYAYAQNSPTVEIDPRGEWLVFIAAVATVGALLAGGLAIAERLRNGVINRGIQLGAQSAANPGSVTVDVVNQRLGPNPGPQAVREIAGAVVEGGVIAVTNVPTPFMVPAKGVKAIYHVTQGDGKSGIKEGIGLVPGPVGEVGDIIQNVHSIAEGSNPSPDCPPPGGK
ncbi:MAG: RHS repeat-associated core domain-containing protein, partial [Anaerolineae bacterium]